jgi:dipeptidyl aminopeptidase/acylaminoacyl peptidase
MAIDLDGQVQTLVDETSETFIDYAFKTYFHWLDADNELIWMSERDGWNHLYLYDTLKGTVKRQITSGPWMVREVLEVDVTNRQIYFMACGLNDGEDPYHEHYVRSNFEGTEFTVLTDGDAMHEISVSPKGRYFIDRHTRADLKPKTELRRRNDGSLVCVLEEANIEPLLDAGFPRPQRFVAKGRDGTTDIWGLIFTPSNLDPTKKYPVVEYIYAGPHDYHVPKAFYTAWNPQPMAELGFILVQIDGMGTNWRGKKFHDVCWKNLKDAGFPDRKQWIKAAAKERPYMDLSRVGIYGGSAGGQNAMAALLWHNDFYHAAAADCGCHDNRMDKIWWNEAWMGWPVGPQYAASSNVENAHLLQGDLLLTVGEADTNVDPASTMQVVDALIKADKDFELLVVPGGGHSIGSSSPYAKRRLADFFVRKLWNTEPRHK